MRILYLECNMGAAGDMLAAALLELMPDREEALAELNGIGIPRVTYSRETVCRCGICGTHLTVTIDGAEESEDMHAHHHSHDGHHHHHGSLHEIEHLVTEHLALPDAVKEDVLAVYRLIAEAESAVHGVPVTEIHFHEVGTMDALADIAAVCLLLYKLAPDQILASPVCVGSGQVKCAHGVLPVPAPATAYLLKGVPSYSGAIQTELCTPTGAALLKRFASAFGERPTMQVGAIGYGMGKKELEAANCVRAFWGETQETGGDVRELSCNLDDMTAEAIAFAMETLLEAGALDVWTTPITMKKSRLGTMLSLLCREEDSQRMAELLFRHTTTIGVREYACRRYTLDRTVDTVSTPYGDVHRKTSCGYGVTRKKYEYEDLARIAKDHNMALNEVISALPTVTSKGIE